VWQIVVNNLRSEDYISKGLWRLAVASKDMLGKDGMKEALDAVKQRAWSKVMSRLNHDDWVVREAAVKSLGKIRPVTPKILEVLVAMLQDDHWRVEKKAGEVLGEMVAETVTFDIKAAVMALLEHETGGVRMAALKVIVKMPVTQDIQEAFVAMLKDDRWRVRMVATEVLGKMAAECVTPEIKAAVMALLNHERHEVRGGALEMLGKMPHSQDIQEAFVAMLKDDDYTVRSTAILALSKMPTEFVTPSILDAMKALCR